MLKIKSAYAYALISFVLIGCGGGGGSTTDTTQTNINETITTSGKVIDGYIKNAKICLDSNLNNSCDKDESSTSSDSNGGFSINLDKTLNLDKSTLIAYGGIDLDDNKDFKLILKSIATQENITPITTIIAELVTKYNIDFTKAKDIVAKNLEISAEDIDKDPIEKLIKTKEDKPLKALIKIEKLVESINQNQTISDAVDSYQKIAKAMLYSDSLEDTIKNIVDSSVLKENLIELNNYIDSNQIDKENKDEVIQAIDKAQEFVIDKSEENLTVTSTTIATFVDNNYSIDKDKTPPVITLKGDNPLILEITKPYEEFGADAIDDVDGEVKVTISSNVDTSKVGEYQVIYTAVDSSGNEAKKIRTVAVIDSYPYVPKGEDLDYKTTFRFLEKTSFGPTQELLIKEVQEKGAIAWLDEQLNQTYELNDSLVYQTLKMGQTINPFAYNHEIEEYMAEDTTLYLPPWGSDHLKVRDYFFASWFKDVFWNKKQVQLRVAYALSQIIVASDSAGIFREKYQGLAAYYDLMKKHAFGNYTELLKEVSISATMGYYLTFYGNQKKHLNEKGEWVYPDENYAREVMQLFSISPFLLNMDGSKVLDKDGKPIPSYTQNDVNELARVFTGFDFRLAKSFGNTGTRGGDLIHKMDCHQEYHDTDAKVVLGKTIPSGGSCYDDVNKAIDILMNHQNSAPFIAKKLIMRLAKSNPSADYVQRVAEVFADNGKGERGDIKATVRAIYLDPEFWDDVTHQRSVKYKEPLIAFTQMARTFNVKPYPKWHLKISSSDTVEIRDKEVVLEDTGLIWIVPPSDAFSEGPTQSKTVFNFYSDDYTPSDSYFLDNKYVAPEIQIQTDGALVAYHNYIYNVLLNEKNYALNRHGVNLYNPYQFKVYTDMKEFGNDLDMIFHPDKFYFDLKPYYDLVEETLRKEMDGKDLEEILVKANEQKYLFSLDLRKEAITKVVDLLDKELTGNTLNSEFKQMLVDKYAVKLRYYDSDDLRLFYMLVLKMLVQMVVIYDDYKVE